MLEGKKEERILESLGKVQLMDLEKLATAAVTRAISTTDRLNAFINSGDKEPAFDGNIYIHNDKRHTKEDLKKVATQVKGKAVSGSAKIAETITYPVKMVDLDAYLNNGGSMYFVVYLDKATGNTLQIYYASLLPFRIMKLKEGKANKTSINVPFKQFPDNNQEKTAIFLDFYKHSKLQHSFAGESVPTIEELQNKGVLESLTLQYAGLRTPDNQMPFPTIVDGEEMYVYANIKGGIAPIPVEYHEEVSHLVMTQEDSTPICVGKEKFFDFYKITSTARKTTFDIGGCLYFSYAKEENQESPRKKIAVNISIKGTLNQRLKTYPFLATMMQTGSFTLGNCLMPVYFPKKQREKIETFNFSKKIAYLKEIKALLEKLNVGKDLDLDKCTNSDFWKLQSLRTAIETGKPIYGIEGDLPNLINVNIANLHLVMICKPSGDGGYYLWDFFSKTMPIVALDQDDNPHPVSQYSILKKEDFWTIDNMNFQSVVSDCKRIDPPQAFSVTEANQILLEMLNAYDEKQDSNLLSCIEQLSDWLLEQTEHIGYETATINYLQIKARQRNLTFKEKQELTNIAANSSETLYKIGAFILLGEIKEANDLLQTLDVKDQETFQDYPIYHLLKVKEGNQEVS